MESPELFWDKLLSRQPEQVMAAYSRLLPDEQVLVLRHLECMATEPGWHSEQRFSAQAALDAITDSGRKAGH